MVKLKILKKNIRIDDFLVFASLPDMGKVGGIVSSFLSESLKAEVIAEISSIDKPWVHYSNGIIRSIRDIYKLSYDEQHRLIIFTGESQPQEPGELYRLCNVLLDYINSIGKVKRLYSAGGYLREQVTGAPRACGVVNKSELKKLLSKANIDFVGNEISSITWFNGLILGLSGERGIDSIGLFGEISETTVPQPLAAKSIISAFSKLERITIDTKPLDQQYESIMEDMQKKRDTSKYET